MYEMLTGLPPFYDENTNEMYRKILAEPLHFPGPEVVPPAARDLLQKLLDRDATRRLGTNGASEIKVSGMGLEQRCSRARGNGLSRHTPSSTRSTGVNCWTASTSPASSPRCSTSVIRPISTRNLRRKRPPTRTSRDRCSARPCNSNSRGGRTTGRWRGLGTLVGVWSRDTGLSSGKWDASVYERGRGRVQRG